MQANFILGSLVALLSSMSTAQVPATDLAKPPAGAVVETRLITRHFPITFRVHDLSSCMAGKIHVLLCRRYTKGRDLFDLAWYLTRPDHPVPNFDLLHNAWEQTSWKGPKVGACSWRKILLDQVTALDWPAVLRDVEPFLEDPRDRQLLDRKLLLAELKPRQGQ